jgi:hypothetical protein
MLRRFLRPLRVAFVFAALGLAASPSLSRAGDVASADQETIRSIISSQLDAFLRDDGSTAYSYASPGIQTMYPTVDAFMAMVKKGFPPVYRPRSSTFGPILDGANGPLQRVFITGPDGKNWIAEYTLQRQPDGTWRISGCRLLQDTGATI